MDYAQAAREWQEYIEALEEERKKMQAFGRELPLSIQIVSNVIDSYRLASESFPLGRSDCEEASSDVQPVLEEFMPLKRAFHEEEVETQGHSEKMPNWLRSAQLRNREPDPPSNEVVWKKSEAVGEGMKKDGGAFLPFCGAKNTMPTSVAATASSTAVTDSMIHRGEEKEARKARRCWSPELHQRFLNALQQLGGSHVATPKQIKDLMKVDGLTNDEVKSHLQKYRLHSRRPAAGAEPGACGGSSSTGNASAQRSSQFVVVGGMWVPAPEFSAVAANPTAPAPTVYAPVARLPYSTPAPACENKQADRRSPSSPLQWGGRRRGGGREEDDDDHATNSTSSSSHVTTTTASAF